MLVVIAIIALLASLIVPTVGAALDRAKTVKCQSNQKQIAAAMLQYPAEHNGLLPWAQARQDQVGYNDNWAGVLIRNGYISAPVKDDEDDIPSDSVFRCPMGLDDEPSAGSPADSPWTDNPNAYRPWPAEFELDGETKYVHNWYAINGRTEADTGANSGWTFIRVRPPFENMRKSMAGVLLPSRQVMICDGIWILNQSPNRVLARHSKKSKTVMAFMDGSVQAIETRLFELRDRDTRDLFPRFRNYRQ